MRSSIWWAWTVIVDIHTSPRNGNSTPTASILLDPDYLRRARYHPIALHRRKRAPHGILGGRVGDQDDRNRARRLVRFRTTLRAGMALHDRFKRNALLRQ